MQRRSKAGIAFSAGRWPLDRERPTLLFIHGAGSTGAFWDEHVVGLVGRANTLAIDLPGHGQSPPAAGTGVADHARAVWSLIEALAPPRPVPVGFSMGGAIVQQMLADHPGALLGAVLMSTGAKLSVAPAILELIATDYDAYLAQVGQISASPSTDPARLEAAIADRALCQPEVALADFRACDAFDLRQRIPAIETPVLIISAAEDQLTPPAYAEWLERRLPDARRVHLDRAGHLVPVERPEPVAEALRTFLDETTRDSPSSISG